MSQDTQSFDQLQLPPSLINQAYTDFSQCLSSFSGSFTNYSRIQSGCVLETVGYSIDGILQMHVIHKHSKLENILYAIPKNLRLRDGSYLDLNYQEFLERSYLHCPTLIHVHGVFDARTHYLIFTEYHIQATLQHDMELTHRDILSVKPDMVFISLLFGTFTCL